MAKPGTLWKYALEKNTFKKHTLEKYTSEKYTLETQNLKAVGHSFQKYTTSRCLRILRNGP